MKKYSALIMDLKKSRTYNQTDRTDIQNYIKNIISVLNRVFSEGLELDVVFSGGDEVQGLFSAPEAAYLYFRLFNMLISPVEIRAGMGVGEWNVKIDGEISTGQDGPVYHNARYAIENVENSLGYHILLFSGGKNDIYINSVINMAAVLVDNQTEYQNELFLLSELMHPIDMNNMLQINGFSELKPLIAQKNAIRYYKKLKSGKSIRKYPLTAAGRQNFSFDLNPTDAMTDEAHFYVSSGRIKGLPAKLAKILGVSRQSIEKSIKAGNIYQERNFTIAALKLMDKYIREDE